MILDLFAGPGGWDEGLRLLGRSDVVGLEWDAAACSTGVAAGHARVRSDVAQYPTEPFAGKAEGVIASPPCPDFSSSGKRLGVNGSSGHLIFQVPRWVEAVRPQWVACEQVPEVLPWWRLFARQLEPLGYRTWTGVLCAADYGVPQERRRAFLLARLGAPVLPPSPTHAENPQASMLGALLPWVSMADGLGWGATTRPCPTVTAGGTKIGGAEPIARGGREALERARDSGEWVVNTRQRSLMGGKRTKDYKRPADRPAPTLTGQAGGFWQWEKPATTVCGDPRITATEPIKLTVDEALTLQGFRTDYPVQGSRTKQFEQIGNAVPPPLAAAVLSSLLSERAEAAA